MEKSALARALVLVAVCGGAAARGTAQDGPPPDRAGTVIANLRSGDVEVRRNAANRLVASGRDAQRQALPMMIDLLMKEKDGQVRLAILDAVTALGHDASSAVPALIHTLHTDYGGQRQEELHQDYRSALALAEIGKPAVEGLRGLLKERKESVRAEVVMGLGRIGPDAGAAVPDLIPLLGDKSERIGREATRSLGRIGTAAVVPLIAACSHKDVIIRARAVESFAYLPAADDRVIPVLVTSARDVAPEVRAAALKSVARFAVPDDMVLPITEDNLRNEDERVRLAVVDLLSARRAILPRLAPELESLLTAKNDGVARHAAFLLSRLGAEGAPRLLNALREPSSRIDPIAEALAEIGRPVAETLNRAIDAPEPRVRRGAALAMGQIRPVAPGTARKLTAGLADPDREVKAASLTAIGYLGPRAGEAVPAVRALLKDGSPEIRIQVIEILAHAAPRDDQLLGDFRPLLDDADPRVQRRAIDAVRALGPKGSPVLGVVIGKLNDKNPEVRLAAVEFVESHGLAAAAAVPQLTGLLDDAMPKVRTIAARTLGGLGKAARPAFARLTPLLGADQAEVREAATSALGSLELDAEVLRPPLARALRDSSSEVRLAASRTIQRLGPRGAIFIPDIILLAEKKENARSAERLLRRFERGGPDVRSLPELVKQLDNKQDRVRLLAIRFLGLAGRNAQDALPALERMRDDPSVEVRKQAQAACERIKKHATSA